MENDRKGGNPGFFCVCGEIQMGKRRVKAGGEEKRRREGGRIQSETKRGKENVSTLCPKHQMKFNQTKLQTRFFGEELDKRFRWVTK